MAIYNDFHLNNVSLLVVLSRRGQNTRWDDGVLASHPIQMREMQTREGRTFMQQLGVVIKALQCTSPMGCPCMHPLKNGQLLGSKLAFVVTWYELDSISSLCFVAKDMLTLDQNWCIFYFLFSFSSKMHTGVFIFAHICIFSLMDASCTQLMIFLSVPSSVTDLHYPQSKVKCYSIFS